ncbi:MAG: hypothetical protein JEZ08_03270 [Clostridiales bacterium]|nr:hypothetical protein [Clostridiales bacterium]
MKNDKFKFVNDIESDIVDQSGKSEVKKEFIGEQPKNGFIDEDERSKRIEVIRMAIIMFIISAAIFVFALIWQDDTSLMGICNALWLIVIMEFFIGWMMLMNNMNILSPFVFGAKTFAKMLVGKRMNSDYYTYIKTKEDNPIPKYYYWVCFIGSFISAIPATILLFIVRP